MSISLTTDTAVEQRIAAFIYHSLLLLDARDFKGWLDLCAPELRYRITTYSPEIRKEMTWLDHDHAGTEHLIRLLPRHNSDQSAFTRHATVYRVDYDAERGEAQAVTSVILFRTVLDGGTTQLYAVGKYYDTIVVDGDTLRLRERNLRLDTRDLGIGTHYPL